MSSTEATTAGDGTTDTPQARDEGSSAAERLGGPLEGEQSRDRMSEADTTVDRDVDTAADEDVHRPDTARRAETGDNRETADAAAGEGVRTSDTAGQADTGADRQADSRERERTTLIEPARAESYNSRWNELKSEFVDDPRRAVRGANQLVGEVLDELEELFRSQRADFEQGLDNEQTTTEDLRLALGRYRSFFDRLLSF
jgi:hypothetical protein